MPVRVELEEILAKEANLSIEKTFQGSLIVLLHPETSDTVTKLTEFINSGGLSLFLAQLLKSANDQGLFTNDEYEIEIQIKKTKGKT